MSKRTFHLFHYVYILFSHVHPYLDKDQEEYSTVSVITNNEDFTQSINSRNLYSYAGKIDVTVDQPIENKYKVKF